VVGGRTPVRVAPAEPRAPSKRASFDIAVPRVTVNPWGTARDWRASRPKFFAAVLVPLLAVAVWQMMNGDWFYVNEVIVRGNKLVPRQEIEQASGMRGWNVFFIKPEEVAASVEALPEFKDVQVYVELPNILEIHVIERKPWFVWEAAGKNYWVDDQGIAMRPRGSVPQGWHVRDATGKPVKYGERVNADAFNATVALLNAWKKAPRYFEWTKEHGLTLREEHGWQVYFGSANQMEDKVTALHIVTTQILKDKRSVAFIDLGSGLPYYQEAAAKK
jgi:cell division septal protein FtsQ